MSSSRSLHLVAISRTIISVSFIVLAMQSIQFSFLPTGWRVRPWNHNFKWCQRSAPRFACLLQPASRNICQAWPCQGWRFFYFRLTQGKKKILPGALQMVRDVLLEVSLSDMCKNNRPDLRAVSVYLTYPPLFSLQRHLAEFGSRTDGEGNKNTPPVRRGLGWLRKPFIFNPGANGFYCQCE